MLFSLDALTKKAAEIRWVCPNNALLSQKQLGLAFVACARRVGSVNFATIMLNFASLGRVCALSSGIDGLREQLL